jgi:hypothetical protein
MDLKQKLQFTITRGQYLTLCDALIARKNEGEARFQKSGQSFAKGVGMQMRDDAADVLTTLSLQEMDQVCVEDPIRNVATVIQLGRELTQQQSGSGLSAATADYR